MTKSSNSSSRAELPTVRGEKSKYAKKIIAKFGNGEPSPRWMWWLERKLPVAVALALVLTAGTAFAAGEIREAKPIACAHFDEFKGATGSTMGVCAPSKEGGKPRVLRSYVVAKVVNPATGKPESVMVGFQ